MNNDFPPATALDDPFKRLFFEATLQQHEERRLAMQNQPTNPEPPVSEMIWKILSFCWFFGVCLVFAVFGKEFSILHKDQQAQLAKRSQK